MTATEARHLLAAIHTLTGPPLKLGDDVHPAAAMALGSIHGIARQALAEILRTDFGAIFDALDRGGGK